MRKQSNFIQTATKNNVVTTIKNSYIYQPKIIFKGGSIKWYEDKLKKA